MKNKICGVYCIKNVVNDKRYIGSSVNIYKRWNSHENQLKNNCHHSWHLQKSWNKYGKDNFVFSVIEECNKDNLIEREQYWIEYFNSSNREFGYNILPVAGLVMYEGATYERLKQGKFSITLKQFEDIVYYLQTSSMPITEISDITGVKVDTIYSINTKKNYKNLTKDMNFVKRRIDCQFNGHAYLSESQVLEIINMLLSGMTVLEISQKTNLRRGLISDIKNKHSWKNLTKNIEFPKVRPKHPNKWVRINRYDLDMNLIKQYESVTSAVKELNVSGTGNLNKCLSGKRETAYGSIWRYADRDQ